MFEDFQKWLYIKFNKYLYMVGICISYLYPITISGHFKQCKLNDDHLGQLIKLANIFW